MVTINNKELLDKAGLEAITDEEGNIVAYDPEDIELQPQVSFKVVCDEGYEFVPVITDNKVDFITHLDATKDGYNKFSDKGGYFNLTKIDDNLVITITATAIA